MSERRAAWALLGGTVLVGLLVGEIGGRYLMASKFKGPLIYDASEFTSFTLVPDLVDPHNSREFQVTYEINAEGYRGEPVPRPKPPGVQHVLLMGDSFAFGHGVEAPDTVSAQLERGLRAAGEQVEVINAGFMAGTAPDDAYAFMNSPRAAKLEPDAVVELIFVQNDMRDMWEHEWPKTDELELPISVVNPTGAPNALHGRGPIPFHKSNVILRNSGLVQFVGRIYFAFHLLPERGKALKAWRANYAKEHGGLSPRFARVIVGLATRAKEKGWPLYVGIIPATAQTLGRPAELYDDALAQLEQILEGLSVPYVVFDKPGAGIEAADLYPLDSHWKPAGHKKAALALQGIWQTGTTTSTPAAATPASAPAPN